MSGEKLYLSALFYMAVLQQLPLNKLAALVGMRVSVRYECGGGVAVMVNTVANGVLLLP